MAEKEVLQAIDIAVEMNCYGHLGIPVPDYLDGNVSSNVVKIIHTTPALWTGWCGESTEFSFCAEC